MDKAKRVQFRNDVIVEVGNVEEGSLIEPLTLDEHLHEMD
jgi:hypothetical protein